MAFQKRFIRSCLLFLAVILPPPCGFGRTRQQPLSELRERTGLAIRVSANRADGPVLTKEERKLLKDIADASEQRDWFAAQSTFGTYAGDGTQIYGAAMHAAFRCREYKEGAKIYEQCQANCKVISGPIYNLGIRIFAKMRDFGRAEQIWNDALNSYPMNEVLGSARIAVAVESGDVEMAADTLDKLIDNNVSLRVHHINAAMRACWGRGKLQHQAAKYFFDLLPKFDLSPTVVSFTSLIGTYNTASLQKVQSAYNEMKSLGIKPDTVFAETYIFSLLQVDKKHKLKAKDLLSENSIERIQAARDALADFKEEGLHLSRMCAKVDEALSSTDI